MSINSESQVVRINYASNHQTRTKKFKLELEAIIKDSKKCVGRFNALVKRRR